jgi:1,4-dihydroxy-2-naphthoyl-CoA synthase
MPYKIGKNMFLTNSWRKGNTFFCLGGDSKVEGRKSKVESQSEVSAEASLLDYAEPMPDFMRAEPE